MPTGQCPSRRLMSQGEAGGSEEPLALRCVRGILSPHTAASGASTAGHLPLQKDPAQEEAWVLTAAMTSNPRDCTCGMGVPWGCGAPCSEASGLQGTASKSEVVSTPVRDPGEQSQEKVCSRPSKVPPGGRTGFVISIDTITALNSTCFHTSV